MKIKQIMTVGLAVATLMLATSSTGFAQANRQKDKNNMRNLGIVLGALGIHKILNGDTKTGLLFGSAAVYSAKKYEDQRKAQKTWREYRYSHGKKIGYWVMRGQKRWYYVSYRKN